MQILRKSARVREEQEKCTHMEQVSTLKSPYLPRESKWSKGNAGGPEVDVIDKSQVVVGGTLGEGVEGTQAA